MREATMAATAMPEVRHGRLGAEPQYPEGAAFIDGAYVPIAEARIPITDWGFLRSDCTYDVVHVWQGRFFRLGHHLDRFAQSCAALRLKHAYTRDEVIEILMQLVRLTGLRDAYVEVICTRGVPPRGSRDPRQCQNRFYAFVLPFIWIAPEAVRARGINLHISSIPRIPAESIDPLIKNFHWGDLTRGLLDGLDQGCDMAVLSDFEGNLSEGPGFNIFVVRDGTVTTPERTCLGGITRQTALDLLKEANVRTVIGKVAPDDLRAADEAFITSTAGGILPVTRVDHTPVGDGEPGPLTLRLKDRYWAKHADPAETTPVDYD
jgi:branched-chain amino acid aminotransferase